MSKDPNITPPRSAAVVDLMDMVRFLVLPGAVELLQAFARIPPGALRESVIAHAEVIAQTYTAAPPEQQMPDPLLTASRTAQPPPRPVLEAPTGREPKTLEERIMKLRLAGANKADIMSATGAPRQKVEGVIKAARAAGVKLPPLALGDSIAVHKTFVTSIEQLSGQGAAATARAAKKRGHTVKSYMEARATFVEMRQALKPMDEISKAVKIDEKTLWQWLYSARAAGIDLTTDVPEDAAIEPVAAVAELKAPKRPEPKPLLIPGQQRVFTPVAELGVGALKALKQSAEHRNLTIGALEEMRESIVLLRYNGMTAADIAARCGQEKQFIYNIIHTAQEKGVVFPPHAGPS